MPKERKEDEYALDAKEIRSILQGIYNRRLKAFCLVMASCGCRPVEGLAIRYKDIDFSVEPTKIYLQAKYSKNKLPREIYISSEATTELKKWLHNKYDDHDREPGPDDLVFSIEQEATPKGIYTNISKFFRDVLKSIKFDDRKDGVKNRRKITLYSFRRYVKTTTEDLAGHSFSEYMLGHKKSPYYVKKEHERRAMYKEKCEMHLTYLDYEPLEQHNKSMEATIGELKARVEKAENSYGRYQESTKNMYSAMADAFKNNGMTTDQVSALVSDLRSTLILLFTIRAYSANGLVIHCKHHNTGVHWLFSGRIFYIRPYGY